MANPLYAAPPPEQCHLDGALPTPRPPSASLWLALILGALLWKGFGGLSLDVFTKMTAPPGVAGGLLNSIVGSLIMTAIGLAARRAARHPRRHLSRRIRPPFEALDGVRFINDILLSAPSIVVGLFVYQFCVVPFGHFSGARRRRRAGDHRRRRSSCAPPRTC